jgi:uncharacterized protein with ATP-grasp and redox domains
MKTREHCYPCLKRLIQQVVSLSAGNGTLVRRCYDLMDGLYGAEKSPPEVSNALLGYIRRETGVADPFSEKKGAEFRKAERAAGEYRNLFPSTLEGLLQFSSLGNSLDFFADSSYDVTNFRFIGDVEAVRGQIAQSNGSVLLFADNVGEFFFDLPLIRFLEEQGKRVHYAVKEGPVQNDLSMADVRLHGLHALVSNIISTGTNEVGIRQEQMQGRVKELWESDALVIAKGMGNYETISEFDEGRPVLYILKAKCKTVAEALGRSVGEHTSFIGGAHGSKERVL